jgi:ABC-type protease/lipase transport system fused ATPase/permease subunit
MDVAIKVEHGDFTWDAPPPEAAAKQKKSKKSDAIKETQDIAAMKTPEKVFTLKDINMEIPKGQLTAIVGPVGTGKTSLLEGIIGEMRRTNGTVKFQGSVAYCPQSAWIQVGCILPLIHHSGSGCYRMLLSVITSLSDGHSRRDGIGRRSGMPVLRQISI